MTELTLVRQGHFAQRTSSDGGSSGFETAASDLPDDESRALSAAHRVQRLVAHARLMLAVYGGAFLLLLDQGFIAAASNQTSETSEAVLFVKDCISRGNSVLEHTYELPRLPPSVAEGESYYNGEPHQHYSHPSAGDVEGIPYSQLLRGDLDDSLLHMAAGVDPSKAVRGSYDALDNPSSGELAPEDLDQEPELDATIGPDGVPETTSRPRYYVITSDQTRKIILVLRGTVTAGDIATDLTCRAVSASPLGGHLPPNSKAHEGVLKTALALGLPGRPLHAAVWKQLKACPSYDIELVGHSLGASIVAALGLLWADPATGKTLPSIERGGRHVARPDGTAAPAAIRTRALHAFAYACPPAFDPVLAQYCKPIVTAFVCNNDLVPRLSHQSVLSIRNAIAWICYWDTEAQRRLAATPETAVAADPTANSAHLPHDESMMADSGSESSASTVAPSVSRTDTETQGRQTEAGENTSGDPAPPACPVSNFSTLTLLRKTLEHQNGQMGGPLAGARIGFEHEVKKLYDALQAKAPVPELVIPGRIFVAYEQDALLVPPASFDASPEDSTEAMSTSVRARIYEVTGDRSKAFGQILFGKGMIDSHFPRVYARVLAQLLDVPVPTALQTSPRTASPDPQQPTLAATTRAQGSGSEIASSTLPADSRGDAVDQGKNTTAVV